MGRASIPAETSLPDIRVESNAVFPIALAYQPFETPVFDGGGLRYWAIGGNHERSMVERTTSVVVAAGTPQARCIDEAGPHSCALVKVDITGKIRVEHVPVDVVRWLPQKLSFAESASDEDIKNLLADRGLKIASETSRPNCLGRLAHYDDRRLQSATAQ